MAVKQYPAEIKGRRVWLVRETRKLDPTDRDVISRIAHQLGVGAESLRVCIAIPKRKPVNHQQFQMIAACT